MAQRELAKLKHINVQRFSQRFLSSRRDCPRCFVVQYPDLNELANSFRHVKFITRENNAPLVRNVVHDISQTDIEDIYGQVDFVMWQGYNVAPLYKTLPVLLSGAYLCNSTKDLEAGLAQYKENKTLLRVNAYEMGTKALDRALKS